MIHRFVVATSSDESDDRIELLCVDHGIEVFRGELDNVLDRFYQCAKQYKPEHIVRLTGDCPLLDWRIVDFVIREHLHENSTYTSNCQPPTYPDGLDVEVFKFSILEEAWKNAKLPSELEHVVPYIRNNLKSFDKHNVEHETDLSNYRWTVDQMDDFIFVERVYEELYLKNADFDMQSILQLLNDKPHLIEINNYIMRNEGTKKSYEKDKKINKV